MKAIYLIIILLVLITHVKGQKVLLPEKACSKMQITILYDNYLCGEGTESDWGFSCLIHAINGSIDAGTGRMIVF